MGWSGAVLAGGKSRRFGQDKGRFIYNGKPLLDWVLKSLEPASEVFVVSNTDYSDFGVPTHPDLFQGGDSLSGLHSALAHAKYHWVAVAACDQPFLSKEFWQFLLEKTRPNLQAIVVSSGEFLEPLGALYHKSLEPLAKERIQTGQLKMQALIQSIPHIALDKEELTP